MNGSYARELAAVRLEIAISNPREAGYEMTTFSRCFGYMLTLIPMIIANTTYVSHSTAQTCLAKNLLAELLSKAEIPTNQAAILLLAISPEKTAGKEIDQVTQTSPKYRKETGVDLKKSEADLDKARLFVQKNLPLTEDAQKCVETMDKIKEEIKAEIKQRDKENIPKSMTPSQFFSLK